MDIIIGGLLMFTLASSPITKADHIAYGIYKAQNQMISVIKKYQYNENAEEAETTKIDNLLSSIDDNSKNINRLLKEKNNLKGKIDTVMDLYSYSKTALTNEQMNRFKKYNDLFQKENSNLKENLNKLKDDKYIKNLSNQILKNNYDYSKIYNSLENINTYQKKAIINLNALINESKLTLQIL